MKIENLQNNELKILPVYDNKYIKTNIRKYGDRVYTNFRGLNVSNRDDHLFDSDCFLGFKKMDLINVILP